MVAGADLGLFQGGGRMVVWIFKKVFSTSKKRRRINLSMLIIFKSDVSYRPNFFSELFENTIL